MTKSLPLLLRAAAVVILALNLPSKLAASPVFVPVANFPSPPNRTQAGLVSDGAGNWWGTTRLGGISNLGTVFKINESTGAITTVVSFSFSPTANNRGGGPSAGLVSDGAGNFWGTTSFAGANNGGTVFKVSASSGAMTTVVDFAYNATTGDNRGTGPAAALVSDGAGNFWGTTQYGGASNAGTIFEVNASTGAVTTVVDFANSTTGGNRGANPVAALVSDGAGNFWGTTQNGGANNLGTIFEVNASTGAIITVVDFAGADAGGDNRGALPEAPLVSDGAGNLWGTTFSGGFNDWGTVFEIDQSTGAITTVVDFSGGDDGGFPTAGLVKDGAGNFWGTTGNGGINNGGVVFELNASTWELTTVAEFVNATTGNNRGSDPTAGLVNDGAGNFWGTTYLGGAGGGGTIFEINAGTGTITTVADLGYAPLGQQIVSGLVSDGAGNLWGTAYMGGLSGVGTIFKINESTLAITKTADFGGAATADPGGTFPYGALVSDGAGNLWGTTQDGGAIGAGTIFEINANTGAINTVANFANSTTGDNRGGLPTGGMVSDGAGNLWGTTQYGGINGYGTVFKFNISTGTITTVVDFASSETGDNRGGSPAAGLASDGAGNFWGTTPNGGAGDSGTVFEVNASTGAITTVVDFTNSETGNNRGGTPQAGLVSDGAGNLWGTTLNGGASDAGTVFKVNASNGAVTTVVDFTGADTGDNRGANPFAGLAGDGAGNLWGTTGDGGANGNGTIFEVNANTGAITTLFDFTGSTGSVPGASSESSLSLTPSGFFGTTAIGGAGGGGEIFFIDFGPQIAAFSSGSITTSGATVSGSADPEGIATSVYVQYGTTTNYGTQTSNVALGNGITSAPFSLTLSGLSSGTTYYYQLVFVTPYGKFYSGGQSFSTVVAVPTSSRAVGSSGWRVGRGKPQPKP
jgi:uncharacterized repeat protein (TIGR03803 family)